jgi:hypothetical protein
VIIQLRSIGRADPDDLSASLPTLSEAAAAVDLDHSQLAVVLDWVQYRKNFRAPVMVRPSHRTRSSPSSSACCARAPRASASWRPACGSGPTCGEAVHIEEIYVEIAAPASLRVAPSADVHLDTTRASSSPRTCSRATSASTRVLSWTWQARGLDHQLDRRPHLPTDRRAQRLRGDRRPFAYREGSNISVLSARHRDAYRRPSSHHDDHELATEARNAGFGAVVA